MAKKTKKDPPPPDPKEAKQKKKAAKTLTPEKEDSAPSKPQRGLAIGDNFGWTGKLPATLLYEHCLKQKWNKVVFDMRKTGKGFIGVVDLSWENPKTKEVIHLRWSPETDLLPPRETTNEARHFAATYAMYRLNYVKNLKMVLPTIFRDYWADMDAKRLQLLKKDKMAHDKFYNANPFQVHLDTVAEKNLREKERKLRENSESKVRKPTASIGITVGSTNERSTTNKKPNTGIKQNRSKVTLRQFPIGKKAWENAPFVDFPTDIRAKMESSIKHHINWVEDLGTTEQKDSSSDGWADQLTDLGFRPSHAKEAVCHTLTFVDALEWLLFHVPEDDLPVFFAKRDEDNSLSLKISTDIQTEYLLQRLSLSGFDKDEILATFHENGRSELQTSIALTHMTASYHPEPFDSTGDEFEMWLMELEGIESIGSNSIAFMDDLKRVVTVLLNAVGITKGMLLVKVIFAKGYPNVLPGVQIVVNDASFKLANYIKLSIVRQLLEYILNDNLIGQCMVFTMVEWLENNVAKVIENPGPLLTSSHTQISGDFKSSLNNKKLSSARSTSRSRMLLKSDIQELLREYEERIKLALFKTSLSQRQRLPAWKKRDELVKIITSNKVTLITGETGSGKSTQIVQYILDHMCSLTNFDGSIICTQPRRISTIGLAERISDERVTKVGNETGYIIRGENKTLKRTRLLFVTTGVLLRMLQSYLSSGNAADAGIFEHLEYIFIDEVHERSVDSDLLLIILKKIIGKLPKLKIVLMSATINTDVFMNYFDTPVNHLHIEGRTFPIDDFYLDTILQDLDFSIQTYDGQIIKPKADSNFFKTGNLNYDLIAQLCLFIDEKLTKEGNTGSILIFLPGIMEISRCIRKIESGYASSGKSCWCLPLHSALSLKDQARVFKSPPKKTRKVVVSTNIAETSITIPDCVVVIDGGRSKSMFFDAKANTSRLVENWCSRAEMSQRRGRSGRIQNGNCYHLYTRETEKAVLGQPIPEIRRTRLENLYLVVKSMGIKKVSEFLNSGLDPPEEQSLNKARSMLFELGALTGDDANEGLSHLGKYLSYIPTDLQSGKLLILGCIFRCVEICLTIAAICSGGSPFSSSFDIKDEVRKAKSKFGKNQGDLMASALAYHEWESLPHPQRKKFISENHLSYLTLQDIQSTRTQYLLTLKEIGFLPFSYRSNVEGKFNLNSKNFTLIRAIITGSFTPQLARVQLPDPKYAQTIVGAVEIDADAKLTKFWIRNEKYIDQCNNGESVSERPATRAFIHPSSLIFSDSGAGASLPNIEDMTLEDGSLDMGKIREQYDMTPSAKYNSNAMHKSPFVVYTSSNETSKLYLRDITPTTTVGALLFGGEILFDVSTHISTGKRCPGIVLDKWMPVRTWCKNGVLLKRLRVLLDQVIENRLSNPEQEKAEAADDEILDIVTKALTVEARQR
ncbi:P-loop containing nucleoside triphosphate hydrolase protein [Metschnikowia bicuspidata var. bicuspidata NRRL YB-4993]|uniref:p-loop containing nucleoside triphosphate hydrolase protein n=1 Tax=Metschnikowia bicuspidata var. bicuspidata NRRL YB-4993 TaxID=869754 RepID=A0A1A0H6Z3_9ASCO|nr:P-loop containing nucleoside triphosphate hydrolase protein [Metschnikowia bicuspidata var. bicuspidata NRRL YB-4993]OBA19673.1 P-loop containing nucleoside triphosphate hydrolase protein [Metschnikowia bicuspidata var. bicuspidata NRRL YB-4993]